MPRWYEEVKQREPVSSPISEAESPLTGSQWREGLEAPRRARPRLSVPSLLARPSQGSPGRGGPPCPLFARPRRSREGPGRVGRLGCGLGPATNLTGDRGQVTHLPGPGFTSTSPLRLSPGAGTNIPRFRLTRHAHHRWLWLLAWTGAHLLRHRCQAEGQRQRKHQWP